MEEKKSKLPIILCVLLLVVGVFALGILVGSKYVKGKDKCEIVVNDKTKEEPKEEEKDGPVEVDKDELNKKLALLNTYLQLTLSTGSNYRFDNIKNNEEILKTDKDKIRFAWYVVYDYVKFVNQEEIEEKTGVKPTIDTSTISLDDFKDFYKKLYDEELNVASIPYKVVNNYIVGSIPSGMPAYFPTYLNYLSFTKKGDVYTLTVTIYDCDVVDTEPTYTKTHNQIVMELVKVDDNLYTIKSMKKVTD